MDQTIKPDIIFENDYFIVINKPSGLLSVPDRMGKEISLKKLLLEKYPNIYTVHRIDKGTSGIILFAKDEATHKELSVLFQERAIEKIYFGLVHGAFTDNKGVIDASIAEHPAANGKMIIHAKGKPSLTEYEVEERFRLFTWLKFNIHTGRTHQIRLHCQHIGHSIVCDEFYGDAKPILISSLKKNYKLAVKEDEEKPILSRQALHAYSLQLTFRNKDYFFEADIPKDLRALLQQLRKLNAVR